MEGPRLRGRCLVQLGHTREQTERNRAAAQNAIYRSEIRRQSFTSLCALDKAVVFSPLQCVAGNICHRTECAVESNTQW
jgi:hypothetical protein